MGRRTLDAGAAGERDDLSSGGTSAVQQAIAAGLLDELWIHLVPLLVASGVWLFEQLGPTPRTMEPLEVSEADGITHLRFRLHARE
jgi:dihydrofolate reductase